MPKNRHASGYRITHRKTLDLKVSNPSRKVVWSEIRVKEAKIGSAIGYPTIFEPYHVIKLYKSIIY